jgi:hypothetical protein
MARLHDEGAGCRQSILDQTCLVHLRCYHPWWSNPVSFQEVDKEGSIYILEDPAFSRDPKSIDECFVRVIAVGTLGLRA